jgi:hypothetical protein
MQDKAKDNASYIVVLCSSSVYPCFNNRLPSSFPKPFHCNYYN